MLRSAITVVVTVLVAVGPAGAQTPPADFVTVDAIRLTDLTLHVTGIVEGGQTAVTRSLNFANGYGARSEAGKFEALRSCKELAYVVMSKPGQYQLRASDGYPPSCGLVRVNP
jgi:hypothetical protein